MKKLESLVVNPRDMIETLIDLAFDLAPLASTHPNYKHDKWERVINRAYQTMDLMEPDGGYIYVLHAEVPGKNLVKIGCSKFIDDRLTTLGIQIPFSVEVALVITVGELFAIESEMHKYFKEFRQKGEWFEVPSLGETIAIVKEQGYTYYIQDRYAEGGEDYVK